MVTSKKVAKIMNEFTSAAAQEALSRPVQSAAPVKATNSASDIPGFGPLTRIETDYGLYPAQALRVRDKVRLRTGRFCPIARIDRLVLDEAFLLRNREAQPLLIEPGRLGYGQPSEPVLLAPGQRLSDRQGFPASLCTVHNLFCAGMAHRRPERFVTYVLFSFPEPEDVCSGGLWLRVEPPAVQPDDGDD